MNHFYLADHLQQLSEHDVKLLNLEAFQSNRKTGDIASEMRDRNTFLSTQSSATIGRLAKLFLGQAKITAMHITEFVARVVDGFSIHKHSATDIHSMSSIAQAFATAFGPHPLHSHQEIMAAFLDGVEDGRVSSARWSKSRSGRKYARRR